jgi:hypothetical protein
MTVDSKDADLIRYVHTMMSHAVSGTVNQVCDINVMADDKVDE